MQPSIQRILLIIPLAFAALSLQAQPSEDSTFSLGPGDVTEAVIDSSEMPRLQVTLTAEKTAELQTFTTRNVNKQVRITVGGKLRSEPFIREPIAGPLMEIFVKSSEEALATVKTLMTSTVKFEQLYKWSDASGRIHYAEKPPSQASVQSPTLQPVTEDKDGFQALHG